MIDHCLFEVFTLQNQQRIQIILFISNRPALQLVIPLSWVSVLVVL